MKFKLRFSTLSMVLAAILVIEGAALAINARQIIVKSIGGILQGTVMLAGAQLLIIGLVALLALVLPIALAKKQIKILDKKLPKLLLSWLPLIAGVAVLIEGLVVVYYSSGMYIAGTGWIRSIWMAAFGAQLFSLGTGLVLLKLFAARESSKLLVRGTMFLVLAAVGLLIYGIASKSYITGIGGILKSTVQLGGTQLFVLSVIGIILMLIEGRGFMQKKMFGHKLGTMAVLGVATIICIEGMVLAGFAARFKIDSIGWMLESTMLLAGLGVAILALMVPASYVALEKEDRDARKISQTACLFLVFLLPFSLLI